MTTNEAMKIATDILKRNGATGEQIAKVEIAIQYIGNPDFREKLNEFAFNANLVRLGQSKGAKIVP